MDKNLFLKNMEEMIAIAKTNGNQIDHKELLDYFSDYNLNEEAKKLLIASFIEAGIRVLGVDEAQIVAEEEAEAKANVSEEEQGAIRFYEEELSQMDLPGEEEQKELITSWLADKEDGEAVIESFLPQILEIARNHMGKGVLFGDLVQEGNIGLLEAMAIYQDGDAEGFLAHAKSAVVGISGGLDSTLALLVSAKAFDALGMDRSGIVAVTMPCFGTTDRTYQNACKMSVKLGATLREIPVGAAVEQHFKDIGHDPEDHSVTYENSQARERTQVLMDVANQTGGIVIGTGDMSELALGWATYNGDHMSMYGVNASVPKTLVRHLVHYYADTCEDQELKEVLYDVLDTPVSPELLPPKDGEIAQKTEDLVGPYELHDFFLYYLLRFSYEPSKIYRIARYAFEGEYDDATIYKWLYTFCRRFFIQQFKRSCLPDGPKVGTVALSPRGDWRMPSDACSEVWLRDLEKVNPEVYRSTGKSRLIL